MEKYTNIFMITQAYWKIQNLMLLVSMEILTIKGRGNAKKLLFSRANKGNELVWLLDQESSNNVRAGEFSSQ